MLKQQESAGIEEKTPVWRSWGWSRNRSMSKAKV